MLENRFSPFNTWIKNTYIGKKIYELALIKMSAKVVG